MQKNYWDFDFLEFLVSSTNRGRQMAENALSNTVLKVYGREQESNGEIKDL